MTIDRPRLEKLLGMLGSDNETERATAGRMIHHMAHLKRLTIVQLIEQNFGTTRRVQLARPAPVRKREVNLSTDEGDEASEAERVLLNQLVALFEADRINHEDARFAENTLFAYVRDADMPKSVRDRVRRIVRFC